MSEAKVIIKGENQIGNAVKSANSDLQSLGNSANSSSSAFNKFNTSAAASAAAVAVVGAAVKKYVKTLKEFADAAILDESYMLRLKSALDGSQSAFDSINQTVSELESRITGEGDSVKALAGELAAMGKSTDEVNKILEASVSLASATGISVDSAYSAINSSLQGTTKSIAKLGIEVSDLSKEQLQNGAVVDRVIEKYSELSKKIAEDSTANKLDNIHTSITHIKENLGYGIIDAISPALETLYGWLLKIEDWSKGVKDRAEENKQFREQQSIIDSAVNGYWHGDQKSLAQLQNLTYEGIQEALSQFTFADTGEAIMEDYEYVVKYLNKILEKGSYVGGSAGAYVLKSSEDGWQTEGAEIHALIKTITEENAKAIYEAAKARYESIMKNGFDFSMPEITPSAHGSDLNNMLDGAWDTISSAMGIFGDMLNGMNPLLATLQPILESFAETIAPALEKTIEPIMTFLEAIGETLANMLLPVLDALEPIFENIVTILSVVLAPVLSQVEAFLRPIVLVLDLLNPILTGLAKVFTVLTAPVMYLADLFSWLGSWVTWLGSVIAHIFNPKKQDEKPGKFHSDAFSGLPERLANIDGGSSSAVSDATVSSAGATASYSGGTTVHINIYQNSPVVGSNGMEEFAKMIKNEFLALDYYGVTA